MSSKYQERIFLTLMDDPDSQYITKIMRSPLGLAGEIIKCLFENYYEELIDNLDVIKQFAAGITSAENLSEQYRLAHYYPYMFSFNQFVQSSYRARQGKALEEILKSILSDHCGCNIVPSTIGNMRKSLNMYVEGNVPNLDMDGLGIDTDNNKIIILQIRSRDDTGGTTAKGSLVDFIRKFIQENKVKWPYTIMYLVCVWDERESQQKSSTIKKMYSSLESYIDYDENDFTDGICNGIELADNVNVKFVYGTREIATSLYDWAGNNNQEIFKSINDVITKIENWDDLWIAYSVANLELEIMSVKEMNNIKLIDEKYNQSQTKFDFSSYSNLVSSVESILENIIPEWNEETLPFNSVSDNIHYIRDLLFLRACYEKLYV